MSNIQDAMAGVVTFQSLIGKLDKQPTNQDILLQAKLILEEAKELLQAVEEGEGEEQILKETCDCLVVVFGLVAQLNLSGYDVFSAMKAVNDNNMSKICSSQTDAAYTKVGYESTDPSGGYYVKQLSYDKWGVFNKSDKLQKPIGYSKCSVKQFIPYQEGEQK